MNMKKCLRLPLWMPPMRKQITPWRLAVPVVLVTLAACGGGGGVTAPVVPAPAPTVAPITLADLPTISQVGGAEITEGSTGFGDHTLRFKGTVTERSGRSWSVNSIRYEATPNQGGMNSTPSFSISARSQTTYDIAVYFRSGDFDKHRVVFDFATGGTTGYRVLLVLTDLTEPRARPNPGPAPKPPTSGCSNPPATCNIGDKPWGPPKAMCNDGAWSCSTGSGTCSSHGGVACWL